LQRNLILMKLDSNEIFEGISDVFAQINSAGAGGVTAGLKKVTADMKTKNRPAGEVREIIIRDMKTKNRPPGEVRNSIISNDR
jgi:hypothetical protein